jgi:hypothetical protein
MKQDTQNEMMTLPSRATMLGVPGDTARRRGVQNIVLPFVMLSFFMGLGIGVVIGGPKWGGILCTLLAMVALGFFYRSIPQRGYGYFKGARGEEMIASELAHLPATWTIFNGLILPNGCDIDHVAVGPQGVFVIETKHWRGSVEIVKGQMLANGRLLPEQRSPILQVRRAMAELAALLEIDEHHLNGVICFAGKQFLGGTQRLDEISFCSYLQLGAYLQSRPVCLDDTALARVIATLNTLTITEGL